MMNYYNCAQWSSEALLAKLGSSRKEGLPQESVYQRQKKYGPNLVKAQTPEWWAILLRQFSSPFVFLLLMAAGLAFILNEHLNGLMIVFFVGLNALLSFYQEYRSEKTLSLLRKYLVHRAQVRRDGKEDFADGSTLVPGDIIIVKAGDVIPADIRFLSARGVTVDESVLTGESLPTVKTALAVKAETEDMTRMKNIGFSGTTLISGKAEGVVFNTGKKTVVGGVAKLALETERQSGFEKAIAKLSRFILYLVAVTLVLEFGFYLLIKPGTVKLVDLVLFFIALAVSVIPEALPVVISFSLSQGALRLAKNKVVVKRLSAIEDLGSIEVLCTDKTGTLTENSLTVASTFSSQTEKMFFYANLAGFMLAGQKEPTVNAFDRAMWQNSDFHQKRQLVSGYEMVEEIPFDSQRRRDAVLVKSGREYEMIVRGAPESLIALAENLDRSQKLNLNRWMAQQGRQGNRVLAVARKKMKIPVCDLAREEKGLFFLGLISFSDPVKKSTLAAVRQARQLGVEIKILTGDRKEVAGALAVKIGLISSADKVVTGDQFDRLSLSQQMKAVEQCAVFARVSPRQKYDIVRLLQEKREVGFLGEGINDAPALKAANVALVVQGAVDIARESADIVLLHKSLAVIIDGIKEGRRVFANTIKYIKTTLVSNFGNFYAIALISLLIDYLPLLPLQILLLNLLSDFPMIAIATDAVNPEELLEPRKYLVRDIGFVAVILGAVSTVFDFVLFRIFMPLGAEQLRTYWFIGSVLTELALIFALRTRFFAFLGKPPSLVLTALSIAAAFLAIFIPVARFGQEIFGFAPPSTFYLGLILSVVVFYFAATEGIKIVYYQLTGRNSCLSSK